jgi:hypothetical protein
MLITASRPVVVFSAHAGTLVPNATSYADHLEDWQPPLADLATD